MECYGDETILLYLDGELDQSQAQAFEQHSRNCPACRRTLEEYRSLYRELAVQTAPEMTGDFTAAVMTALPNIDFARQRQRRQSGYLLGALLVSIVSLLPYLIAFPGLGVWWDSGKVLAGAGWSLLAVAGVLVRTAVNLLDILLRGLGTMVRVLPVDPGFLFPAGLLLLLGEVMLIKYAERMSKGELTNE